MSRSSGSRQDTPRPVCLTDLSEGQVTISVIQDDCLAASNLPKQSVDLIVTSPPYADARSGGIPLEEYVEWFRFRSVWFREVLKDDGTFILNIKEKVINGERSTYVMDVIKMLRWQGWLWTEEFIWHKKNCHPGKWPNRFRDAWERVLQFNKQRDFKMYQDEVRVPVGEWAKKRLRTLSAADLERQASGVGSGFGKRVANWVGRDLVYPTNVLHFATESSNKGHDSAFPKALPEFFIKLFTQPGDMVMDPFLGSGTTLEVTHELGRNGIGFEIDSGHYATSMKRLKLGA